MTEEEPRHGDDGGDLDPEQVRQGREEEMNYMIMTLKRFEFGAHDFKPKRETKRRLFRGDASAGSEEGFVRVRCGCA